MDISENHSLDGYGGRIYEEEFEVPTYDDSTTPFTTLSWDRIDLFYESNASSTVLSTIAFTICLVSLLYVVALTPSSKRRKSIHNFLLLALIFKLVDRAVAISLLLRSPNVSAYVSLTMDIDHIQLSTSFRSRVVVLQCGAILTFACLQACLYLHGKPLLTVVNLRSKLVYTVLLCYLISSGILAFVMRTVLAVLVLHHLNEPLGPPGPIYPSIYKATLISYAVSIGSWSLVFFCTSISIIINRRRQLLSRNQVYESVLNLIAIIGLESFILPLTFAILQLAPSINIILSNSPEVLLVPSVLLVLPLASLFGPSRNNEAFLQHSKNAAQADIQEQKKNKSNIRSEGSTRYLLPRGMTTTDTNMNTSTNTEFPSQLSGTESHIIQPQPIKTNPFPSSTSKRNMTNFHEQQQQEGKEGGQNIELNPITPIVGHDQAHQGGAQAKARARGML